MKQLNKLLNILNIISIIVLQRLVIGNEIAILGPVFEKFITLIILSISFIHIIFNVILGVKNISLKEKKIGIISFIITIFFIITGLTTTTIKIPFIITEFLYLILFILSIVNLVLNRKNVDTNKKIYITILFIILLFVYILITSIPNIFVRLNIKQFENVASILCEENDTKIIIYQEENNCKIFDNNGNIVSDKNYEYIKSYPIFVNNKKVDLIGVKDKTGLWIINYKGEKVKKFYTLFENSKNFLDRFVFALQEWNYKIAKNNDNYLKSQTYMTLDKSKSTKNQVYFNNLDTNVTLLVEFNYNEINDNTFFDLYKIYLEEKYDENVISNYEDLYKYKKTYYLINNLTRENVQLDCQNIIFSSDSNGSLSVSLYSNGYIPYYDEDFNGYFNLNGDKFSFNNKYVVYDTLENYQIVKDTTTKDYYVIPYNQNDELINIGSHINKYGNDFIDTYFYTYIINNNLVKQLSKNEHRNVDILNIDIIDKIQIYEEIGIID